MANPCTHIGACVDQFLSIKYFSKILSTRLAVLPPPPPFLCVPLKSKTSTCFSITLLSHPPFLLLSLSRRKSSPLQKLIEFSWNKFILAGGNPKIVRGCREGGFVLFVERRRRGGGWKDKKTHYDRLSRRKGEKILAVVVVTIRGYHQSKGTDVDGSHSLLSLDI